MSSLMVQAGRLPVPAAPIFGREDELARIPRWIREGARLVTLTGHPGSGKTRLALHAARQVRQDHGWPAEFLPLAPLTSADQIAGALARSLDVREDALPITERVQRLLVELGPMLLVLDNLEHLDGAGMTVDYLLGGCPELRVLATSRKPLRAHGERVLEVLAFPAPSLDESLALVRDHPAVQIFTGRASGGSMVVTDADLPDVAAVCGLVGGLPLAIELAAARAASLGIERLRVLLTEQGGRLDMTDGARDPRHRSMSDAIEWSYRLLSPAAREALDRLSVFTGGFGHDEAMRMLGGAPAIQNFEPLSRSMRRVEERIALPDGPEESPSQIFNEFRARVDPEYMEDISEIVARLSLDPVASDPSEVLGELFDAHLVRAHSDSGGGVRYEMLESVREFGYQRLRETGNLQGTRNAHSVIVYQSSDDAGVNLWIGETRGPYRQFKPEDHGNVRTALEWATDPANEAPVLAGRFANAVWYYFQLTGQITEGRMWLERVLELEDVPGDVRHNASNNLSFLSWTQGDIDQAEQITHAALAANPEPRDRGLMGVSYFNLALVEYRRGNFEGMAAHLASALPILTGAGDLNGIGFCDLALGVLARFGGNRPEAERLLDDALENFTMTGYRWGAATARYLSGEAAHDTGDTVIAAERIADGLDRYWEQGDVFGSGACIAALACLAAERSETRRAARLFGAAFAMCERAGVILPPVDLERYQATAAEVATKVPHTDFVTGRGWPSPRPRPSSPRLSPVAYPARSTIPSRTCSPRAS